MATESGTVKEATVKKIKPTNEQTMKTLVNHSNPVE